MCKEDVWGYLVKGMNLRVGRIKMWVGPLAPLCVIVSHHPVNAWAGGGGLPLFTPVNLFLYFSVPLLIVHLTSGSASQVYVEYNRGGLLFDTLRSLAVYPVEYILSGGQCYPCVSRSCPCT